MAHHPEAALYGVPHGCGPGMHAHGIANGTCCPGGLPFAAFVGGMFAARDALLALLAVVPSDVGEEQLHLCSGQLAGMLGQELGGS